MAHAPPHHLTVIRHHGAGHRTSLEYAAGWQVSRVDAHAQQGAGHRLRGVEQVIERPGQVRSGDRGQRRVLVQ